MTPTVDQVLMKLPPYTDQWEVIHPDQSVSDIINEVLNSHDEFKPYYDKIALLFDEGTTLQVCESLYDFCKTNIHYKEETEDEQTSALPTGILMRGQGDCKHYAGFCGGVLDALNRLTDHKIKWVYRFASYDSSDSVPHHVFIVVFDGGKEVWLDPTPGSGSKTPAYYVDKSVETNKKMALVRNISGINTIGIASETVSLRTNAIPNLSFDTGGPWPYASTPWPYYLGLDKYRDYYGDRDINEAAIADAINTAIQNGPDPGHTVTADFVKWVYDNSLRSYNFYYSGGVDPAFDYSKYVPASFSWTDASGKKQTINPPRFVVTGDGRVTFDHDVKLDDYHNYLIHILNAGAQNLINSYDADPFPLKPADLKIFSQSYTGNPGNPKADLLHEHRGTSVIKDVGKALNNAVNFVKDGVLLITGAIPRNAFLALVGINLFHMATDLQNTINNGGWQDISDRWKALGGDPQKLLNTISHGSKQPETDNTTQTVTSTDQISGVRIGNPAAVAAIIAAATPIVLALSKYFTHPSITPITSGAVASLNAANPTGGYTMVGGVLYSNGVPVSMTGQTDAALAQSAMIKNIGIAAVAAGITYFLVNKPGKKKNYVLPLAAGAGAYLLMTRLSPSPVATLPLTQPGLLPGAQPTSTGLLNLIPSATSALNTILNTSTANENTPGGAFTAGGGSDSPIPVADEPLSAYNV